MVSEVEEHCDISSEAAWLGCGGFGPERGSLLRVADLPVSVVASPTLAEKRC